MNYHVNEGSFSIPDSTEDRSVNMLRQLRTLATQVKNFRQQAMVPVNVGAAQLPGVQIATSFKQNNASMYQLQTAIALGAGAVLVLTLSCSSPLTAEQAAYAQQLLDSFVPAAASAT